MRTVFAFMLIVVTVLSFTPPAGAQEFVPANLLAFRTQATIERLGRFSPENRLAYYETMDRLANRLWTSPMSAQVRELTGTAFGEKYSKLVFYDRDGDGFPEEWAYLPQGGGRSQEFGFIFDMNGDGQADYIIFNGGVEFSSKKLEKMVWWNYHLVDTNFDGHTDLCIVNSIGLHAEQVVDERVYAWLYDRDFDGTIDDAEYLGRGVERPLDKAEGKFHVQYAWRPKDYPADFVKEWDREFLELKGAYASLVASLPRRPPMATAAGAPPASAAPRSPADSARLVDVGSYVISPPPGDNWETRIDKPRETVEFTMAKSGFLSRTATVIHVSRNNLLLEGPYVTEEEVADDYTAGEERDMRIRGGVRYTVKDVERGVVQLPDRKLYYMRYKTSGDVNQDAAVLLFFPPTFLQDRYFFVFVLSEACGSGLCQVRNTDFQQIFPLVESLRIK